MKYLLIALLLIATQAQAVEIVPTDKVLHGLGSAEANEWARDQLGMSNEQRFAWTLGLGAGKELADAAAGGSFDWGDLAADLVGWGIKIDW